MYDLTTKTFKINIPQEVKAYAARMFVRDKFKDVFVAPTGGDDEPYRIPVSVHRIINRVAANCGMDVSKITVVFRYCPSIGWMSYDRNLIALDYSFLHKRPLEELEFVLYHELRHFEQYRTGIFNADLTFNYWRGEKFSVANITKEQHICFPWEVDANAFAESKMTAARAHMSPVWRDFKSIMIKNNVKLEMKF